MMVGLETKGFIHIFDVEDHVTMDEAWFIAKNKDNAHSLEYARIWNSIVTLKCEYDVNVMNDIAEMKPVFVDRVAQFHLTLTKTPD